MIEGYGTWMTKGERVDASSTWDISVREKKEERLLPYDISESISKENNENGKRERRIGGYRRQMYNGENESATSYRNNTPVEDLYLRDNIKAPPGLPR